MTSEIGRQLDLVVDLYGCPNRCMHCWLGHMPNIRMPENADSMIMDYFSPFFSRIAFYSWLREPDYCADYRDRWFRDIAISKNARPERFELASFYRIVRDDQYIPFLKEVGVRKVQLTLFGLQETQDRYVGRKGAYEEVMKASELLTENGIIPRWQCFINEENRDEILKLYALAKQVRAEHCPELEFFVHEGSCDGENRKLYPVRIRKRNIPEELIPVYFGYDNLLEERECIDMLKDLHGHPEFHIEEDIVLNISNTFDVFFNITHMAAPWKIGNIIADKPQELVGRILHEDTPAHRIAKQVTWAELACRYGDVSSERAFCIDDYKIFLFNTFLEDDERIRG